MKISKAIHVAVLALVFAVTSTLAFAQPAQPPKPQDGPRSPLIKCLSILQLTDAQKTQTKAILDTARPELQLMHQQLVSHRQALKAAIDAVPQDACAIGTALVRVQADEKAIRTKLEGVRAAVVALLTPEQRARLEGCLDAPKDDAPPSGD